MASDYDLYLVLACYYYLRDQPTREAVEGYRQILYNDYDNAIREYGRDLRLEPIDRTAMAVIAELTAGESADERAEWAVQVYRNFIDSPESGVAEAIRTLPAPPSSTAPDAIRRVPDDTAESGDAEMTRLVGKLRGDLDDLERATKSAVRDNQRPRPRRAKVPRKTRA